jgi:hypothetical protein
LRGRRDRACPQPLVERVHRPFERLAVERDRNGDDVDAELVRGRGREQ